MKKILLTGGTGFIGRNILESNLVEKYEIVAPIRKELDCSDDESVASFFNKYTYFDFIIHAAAKPGHRNAADTTSLLLTNSRMLFNLLKHKDKFGKILNMGSGAAYDMRHYVPKMKEEYFGTYIPADEHGYNKYILGQFLPHIDNVIDFRIFGVFGKYEDYAIRFISNAICKAIFNLPITLRQDRKFDYLYINDLMPILDYFMSNNVSNKAYNITPDQSVHLLDLANLVKTISGKNIDVLVASDGLGIEYSGHNGLLRSEMSNLEFTPLGQAVEELYKWYFDNKSTIKEELLRTDK